jgi:ATP-dependent helicase HepA
MSFAVGQRWVSHADTELGLGIIVEIEPRRITVHFPAVAEDRTYATDRAPLTRLILQAGDVLTRHDGERFTVLAADENNGVMRYTVEDGNASLIISELELDSHIQLRSPRDRLLNNQLDKPADFSLRYQTRRHSASNVSHNVKGLLGARTALLSHQLYIASEVARRFAPRVLLADEVGLGKTIEAGLIISQQLLSGRAQRVLIVVPDALVHQWLVEMRRRFNIDFSLFDSERLDDEGETAGFDHAQCVLTGFSLFVDDPQAREIALNTHWDMVVIDEAHHLDQHSDIAGEMTLQQFAAQLARVTRGLLLLTATPEQAGVAGHFDRLRLLDPDRFPSLTQFHDDQKRFRRWSKQIERLQGGEAADELPEGIDPQADPTLQIEQLLDRHGTGRVLFRNTRASVPGFPERRLHAYPLVLPSCYQAHRHLLQPESACAEADWIALDPRISWIESLLRELRAEKILVICARKDTAVALEHHLHLRAGIRCAAFHEHLSLVERDRAAAYFADADSGAQALICSEIGSEGRNFQFAHHLVCFDLPRNPDLLEQRIGRLDRIGQQNTVEIHVPWFQESAQAPLFRWLNEGLNAFNKSCSVGYALYQQFSDALQRAMTNPTGDISALIDDTTKQRVALETEMREGRDKLLELNSHRPERGQEVIAAIRSAAGRHVIEPYSELLFDRIGLHTDYHSEHCIVIKPTEMLLTGQLPGLEEEGLTATFDREIALARDDIEFLTWEHPLIREGMAIVSQSELGNASMATLKHPQIKAGSVLLECIFAVDCLAPAALEVGRFINMAPLRFVIGPDGRDVGPQLGHDALNSLINPVPASAAANVIRQLRPALLKAIARAESLAEVEVRDRRDQALAQATPALQQELDRLHYLEKINPLVDPAEITALTLRRDETQVALHRASALLDGLRLIIAT